MVYVPELDRQGFADRQRLNREANRPAIKFNQRDNIRDFARSGHGQNYNRMMDIQRQLPNMDRSDPMVQEFKDRRRTLNRYGKNPMGEMLGYTPHEMMDKYVDLSRDVRQTNKPVYNKMYPFTGGFMDYMDQGATLGMLKNAATDILSNVGIGGALDTNEEELRNYANLTYPQDVHPGLPGDTAELPEINEKTSNEQIQALVDEEQRKIDNFETTAYSDILDDAIENQWPTKDPVVFDDYVSDRLKGLQTDNIEPTEPLPFDQGKEDFIRSQNEYIPPVQAELGIPNPQGDFDRFNEYPNPEIGIEFGVDNWEEPPPFNDDLREAGIASMMKSGLNLAGRRPYEEDYRAFVESSGPSKVQVTYEDFIEYYLPRIQESRGVLRAGLNSQGRR